MKQDWLNWKERRRKQSIEENMVFTSKARFLTRIGDQLIKKCVVGGLGEGGD